MKLPQPEWFVKNLSEGSYFHEAKKYANANAFPALYTEAQMLQYGRDCLEAAAKVCEVTMWSDDIDYWRTATKKEISTRSMLECKSEILKLKEELK